MVQIVFGFLKRGKTNPRTDYVVNPKLKESISEKMSFLEDGLREAKNKVAHFNDSEWANDDFSKELKELSKVITSLEKDFTKGYLRLKKIYESAFDSIDSIDSKTLNDLIAFLKKLDERNRNSKNKVVNNSADKMTKTLDSLMNAGVLPEDYSPDPDVKDLKQVLVDYSRNSDNSLRQEAVSVISGDSDSLFQKISSFKDHLKRKWRLYAAGASALLMFGVAAYFIDSNKVLKNSREGFMPKPVVTTINNTNKKPPLEVTVNEGYNRLNKPSANGENKALVADSSSAKTTLALPAGAVKKSQSEKTATKKSSETAKTISNSAKADSVVVKKGDNLWNIAKNYLTRKGLPVTNKSVLDLTNKIAVGNGKYSIGEFETLKSEHKKVPLKMNPNYILPGDTIVVKPSYVGVATSVIKSKKPDERIIKKNTTADSHSSVSTTASSLKSAYQNNSGELSDEVVSRNEKKSKNNPLEKIVADSKAINEDDAVDSYKLPAPSDSYESAVVEAVKEKNKGASLNDLADKYSFGGIDGLIMAFRDYQNRDFVVSERPVINRFDKRIASDNLLETIAHDYQFSDKSLRELKQDYEKKFNISLSESTISKYGRLLTKTSNREEARSKARS